MRTCPAALAGMIVLLMPAAIPAAERTHDITADDYFTIGVISQCAVSPDGRYIAYVEQRWDKSADKRNRDLWIVECKTRGVRRLTFDLAADDAPKWGADGRWIYFSSARERPGDDKPPYNGKAQVWRIGVDGLGLAPVTRIEDGIERFDISQDGKTLYYVVGEEDVTDEWNELREEYGDLEYGHGVNTFSQLWKLELQSWQTEKLVDDKRVIRDFAVTADASRIAMITTPTDKLISHEGRSRVDVFDAATGKITPLEDELWREQAPSPYGWLESPAWSRDGTSLAFGIDFDGYPADVFVAEFRGDDVHIQKLTRPDEVSVTPGYGLAWRGGSKDLILRGEWRARARVYCITDVIGGSPGQVYEVTPGDVSVESFSGCRDGKTLGLVMSGLTHPPDVFAVAFKHPDRIERLTKVNPQVDTWKLPSIQLVQWTSYDGTPVEGILELPPGYKAGQPLPLIVEIHGGPTAATMYRMRFWIYGRILMPAKGYALLSANYRGSTGYGDKFMTDLIGHKNDRDVADILSGVDAMVERGIADPDRLGVMGWSNGGFLTNCLITKTDRFKAASSGAGVLDVAMQWAVEDTPGHVINYQQGFPWNATETMRKGSPLYEVDKIKTPTLIHVGGSDARCPPLHSKALHRALHEYLSVPTELIIYPGAGHGLTTYEHRKAKMEWDLRWFERYLLGQDEEADSPETTPVARE